MTDLPVTLTMTQVAEVLNLTFTRGEKKGRPDRRAAVALVQSGRLRVIDPQLARTHWSVSRAEIERYIACAPVMSWAEIKLRGIAS